MISAMHSETERSRNYKIIKTTRPCMWVIRGRVWAVGSTSSMWLGPGCAHSCTMNDLLKFCPACMGIHVMVPCEDTSRSFVDRKALKCLMGTGPHRCHTMSPRCRLEL